MLSRPAMHSFLPQIQDPTQPGGWARVRRRPRSEVRPARRTSYSGARQRMDTPRRP